MSFGCLLITANVGSIFEDLDGLSKNWIQELLRNVERCRPKFIALHCQEFGGKNYEHSMKYVGNFVNTLLSASELSEFKNAAIFIDEDFSTSDTFTALGSFYFVHESLDVNIWNFELERFESLSGHRVFSANIENVPYKVKVKFPQHFYPDFKWSRKGFMKTRWRLGGRVLDLTNVHLYHDESNFVALRPYPSPYVENRRRALEFTLASVNSPYPQFFFGDFNFRLELPKVIKQLTQTDTIDHELASQNATAMKFNNAQSGLQIDLDRKRFSLSSEPNSPFLSDANNLRSLLEHDRELENYSDRLFELDVEFVPSYPFSETRHLSHYMQTRCPAWCDRVLMNHLALSLLKSSRTPEYNLIGVETSMGDHKPVFLSFELEPSSPSSPLSSDACPQNASSSQESATLNVHEISLDFSNRKENSTLPMSRTMACATSGDNTVIGMEVNGNNIPHSGNATPTTGSDNVPPFSSPPAKPEGSRICLCCIV